MSIIAPASSRWSRPLAPAPPDSRSTVSSSGAAGSGRFGSRASVASSSASTALSSSPSDLARAGDLAHLGDRLVGVLAARLGPGDRLAGLVLLRAQRPRPRGSARGGARRARGSRRPRRRRRGARAPRARRRDPRAAASGRARRRGERGRSAAGRRFADHGRPAGDETIFFACLPEYSAMKRATSLASWPTTMFAGMIAPGVAAVLDRVERILVAGLAHVEVRAVDALAVRDLRRGALRAGGVEGVAARAALPRTAGRRSACRPRRRERRRSPAAGRQGQRETRRGPREGQAVASCGADHMRPRRGSAVSASWVWRKRRPVRRHRLPPCHWTTAPVNDAIVYGRRRAAVRGIRRRRARSFRLRRSSRRAAVVRQ